MDTDVYRCARCGFAYAPSMPHCYKCQLPRGAPWQPMHPMATLTTQAPQVAPVIQPPPDPRLPAPVPAARPNLDHLWYSSKLTIPAACACCMGPPQTSVPTKWLRTGGRSAVRVAVPYCAACASHRSWSGHVGVGVARFLGPLFAAGGIGGGVLLGIAMTKDEGDPQQYASVFAVLFMVLGFAAALFLVKALGSRIAPRGPACSCRGDAVFVTRGRGAWRFRFTNPQFEAAFRGMNPGRPNEY